MEHLFFNYLKKSTEVSIDEMESAAREMFFEKSTQLEVFIISLVCLKYIYSWNGRYVNWVS